MTVVRPGVPEGVSWLDAALRLPDRFTLTREAAQRGGYHSPEPGKVSAVDFTSPPIHLVKGRPHVTPPPPVRVELGHDGYRLERDDTAAYLIVTDPKSIQIGEPPVNVFSPEYAEATRRARHLTAPPLRDGARQAWAVREATRILREAKVPADIVMRRPSWKPGDVIVVEYAPGQPYTYVRGQDTWPVDKGRTPKTDADIDKLWDNGQVRPVLQSGGVPFAQTRLP